MTLQLLFARLSAIESQPILSGRLWFVFLS